MFQGRTLLIATNHGKERVIAPLLESFLGVTCIVARDLNTDLFGTFSGEIERKDDPVATLRNKCSKAIELYKCDLVLASEGSFGPHPSLFFVPADDELLLLYDAKEDFEIMGRELSTSTNFDSSEISTINQLIDFADRVQFPSHGLIIRRSKTDYSELTKGIRRWQALKKAFNFLIRKYGTSYLETDMRAMHNPTRMKVIENATHRLIERIKSCCPICKTPGFAITSVKRGLECSACGTPTNSIISYEYSCQKCGYTTEYPAAKTSEHPQYCDRCNP